MSVVMYVKYILTENNRVMKNKKRIFPGLRERENNYIFLYKRDD